MQRNPCDLLLSGQQVFVLVFEVHLVIVRGDGGGELFFVRIVDCESHNIP